MNIGRRDAIFAAGVLATGVKAQPDTAIPDRMKTADGAVIWVGHDSILRRRSNGAVGKGEERRKAGCRL